MPFNLPRSIGAFEGDPVTLVEDGMEEDKILLFPNPAEDVVYLKKIDLAGNINLKVWNVMGHEMNLDYKVNGDMLELNVKHVASGLYFISMNTGQSMIFLKH